jgi:hypothetical protein
MVGTPIYAAPELWEGKEQTHKVDVWSLFITILWTVDAWEFRQMVERGLTLARLRRVVLSIAADCEDISNIREMAAEIPEERASATQMIVKCFDGSGLTTHPNLVTPLVASVQVPPSVASIEVPSPVASTAVPPPVASVQLAALAVDVTHKEKVLAYRVGKSRSQSRLAPNPFAGRHRAVLIDNARATAENAQTGLRRRYSPSRVCLSSAKGQGETGRKGKRVVGSGEVGMKNMEVFLFFPFLSN